VLRAFRPEKIKGHCFLLVRNSIEASDAGRSVVGKFQVCFLETLLGST
jgi:hypothetical protein